MCLPPWEGAGRTQECAFHPAPLPRGGARLQVAIFVHGLPYMSLLPCYIVLYLLNVSCASQDEVHVAIFVHGFQGAAPDLCLVKAHLMLMFPYLECYCSLTNEVRASGVVLRSVRDGGTGGG